MQSFTKGDLLLYSALFLFSSVGSIVALITSGFAPIMLLGSGLGVLVAAGMRLLIEVESRVRQQQARTLPPQSPRVLGVVGASPIVAALVIGGTRLVWGHDGFTFIGMLAGAFVATEASFMTLATLQALRRANAQDTRAWSDRPARWRPRRDRTDRERW